MPTIHSGMDIWQGNPIAPAACKLCLRDYATRTSGIIINKKSLTETFEFVDGKYFTLLANS